jgi:N-dimethylarginine dimethylaminohydrolase
MSRQRQSEPQAAAAQWTALKQTLQEVGATIELLPPERGLPDLVFTANAAIIHRNGAVMARFRYPQRQGEVPYDEAWLRAEGI